MRKGQVWNMADVVVGGLLILITILFSLFIGGNKPPSGADALMQEIDQAIEQSTYFYTFLRTLIPSDELRIPYKSVEETSFHAHLQDTDYTYGDLLFLSLHDAEHSSVYYDYFEQGLRQYLPLQSKQYLWNVQIIYPDKRTISFGTPLYIVLKGRDIYTKEFMVPFKEGETITLVHRSLTYA